MNPTRIDERFAQLKKDGKKGFVAYLTGGDPSLDAGLEIVKRLEDAGADLIEYGVPFSDPLADGPTIQAASQRALERERGALLFRVDAVAQGVIYGYAQR